MDNLGLFRQLSQTAIEADFSEQGYKIYFALMNQTFGYDRKSDCLSDHHLAELAHIPLEELSTAVQLVLDSGIFDRKVMALKVMEINRYEYSVGSAFLKGYTGDFKAPDIF